MSEFNVPILSDATAQTGPLVVCLGEWLDVTCIVMCKYVYYSGMYKNLDDNTNDGRGLIRYLRWFLICTSSSCWSNSAVDTSLRSAFSFFNFYWRQDTSSFKKLWHVYMGNFDLCGMYDYANAAVNTFHFHLHTLSTLDADPVH